MAKLIKETPVLKGKDAQKFLEEKKKAEASKVDPGTLAKMKENFRRLHSIARF
jgi:hypothetical protein